MQMEPSDKGWLRAHYPRATADQIHDFIERFGMKLDSAHSSGDDVHKARSEAFREMMGTVE